MLLNPLVLCGVFVLPLAALGVAPLIARNPHSADGLFAEVDDELIHRLWLLLDGPNRHLVTDAQIWREIGGLRGLWRMWLQVRTMCGAIVQRSKEIHTEAQLASDDFHVSAFIAIRESIAARFGRGRIVHAKACVRAFLRVSEEFEIVRLAVD